MTTIPDTALAGLGNMGGAIARCLLGQGRRLGVYDIRPEAVGEFACYPGAAAAPDLAALAGGCDVALLSLPSHVEVEAAAAGMLGFMRPGSVLVNLTTGSVLQLPGLTAACAARGVGYVTAPVSQGVRAAAAGRLTVFAAGTPDACARAWPVLEAFTAEIVTFGEDHRAAMAAKLISNYSWAANVVLMGVLMPLAARAGIPLENFQAVMAASCGTTWVIEHDTPSVLDGTMDPSFTVGLMRKDLRLVAELAEELGVPLPAALMVQAWFDQAFLECGDGAPELTPVRLMLAQAGIRLAGVAG
jgi:3-hydroxyisobutyrate dehydrogenase-like beta-hydroxyacid dehydrogenase